MNIYSGAPVISRRNPRGIVAEGVVPDRETSLTFNHAVENYGFIVPPNRYMTGAQWIEQIKAAYDVSQPRNREVVEAIARVMLVEQFKDDQIVVDRETGRAVYRGKASECQKFITNHPGGRSLSRNHPPPFDVVPTRTVDADMLQAADENTALKYLADNFAKCGYQRDGFFSTLNDLEMRESHIASGQAFGLVDLGLPVNVVYYPRSHDDILVRVLDLLKVSPVGKQAFTDKQQEDRRASVDLIAILCNLNGYGALVTSARGIKLERPAFDKPKNMMHPAMIESSMMDFIESLEKAGWNGDSDLFVCRPASSYNTLMNLRPYESLVHSELIGWRIPRGVVEQLRDELHELQGQSQEVRQHGERAI